ncbi:MAG TPA: acyl-CoA carboxylase epsilon subunit [Actinomycetes bacterium]|nr:acyl-CoA carboxylase epsilon subunit [Actinomycetes bacterium]
MDERPILRVVRGEPDEDELAALVAVIAARAARGEAEQRARKSLWAARSRQVRPPLRPAPGAWRASSLPR